MVNRMALLVSVALITGLVVGLALGLTALRIVETVIITLTSPTTITETSTITASIFRVVDARGEVITLSKPVDRIAALTPAIAEIVCLLDCSKLVATVEPVTYPESLLKAVNEGKVVIVGSYWTPDAEKVIEVKPDIVIADLGVPSHVSIARLLEEQGIPVLFVKGGKASSIDDVVGDVMLIASVMDEIDKASEWAKELKSTIASISNEIEALNLTRPDVLVVLGPPSWGLWVAGGGTFIDSIIKASGGVNAAKEYHGWVQLGYDDVLALNPSIIVITAHGSPQNAREVLTAWMSTPLNTTQAFKEGRVCVVYGKANDVIVRPGPRIVYAIKLLAWILHPSVFSPPEDYKKYVICLTPLGAST